jgi:hypothetical protein
LYDDRQREKTILLMVTAVMMVLIVFFIRFSVQTEGSKMADIFRMFTIIMLVPVAVCVYIFVKPSQRR